MFGQFFFFPSWVEVGMDRAGVQQTDDAGQWGLHIQLQERRHHTTPSIIYCLSPLTAIYFLLKQLSFIK